VLKRQGRSITFTSGVGKLEIRKGKMSDEFKAEEIHDQFHACRSHPQTLYWMDVVN
jgi:hypothetical protein